MLMSKGILMFFRRLFIFICFSFAKITSVTDKSTGSFLIQEFIQRGKETYVLGSRPRFTYCSRHSMQYKAKQEKVLGFIAYVFFATNRHRYKTNEI